MRQLSEFDDEKNSILRELDTAFYKNEGRWECKLAEYVVKNRKCFP
jgi:hypothetical protein